MMGQILALPTRQGKEPKDRKIAFKECITEALYLEMKNDDRVIVFGEDVGIKGGVFLVTAGLQKEFGVERCFDTPLNESGILGAAFGMAVAGLRPVAEIQFADFIWPGMDQIRSEISMLRYRSGGNMSCPLVMRMPWGGGVYGGLYHSQSPEAIFAHTPGLKVVVPSTPYDAKGLLISSIRDPDPVIFYEPKRLYFMKVPYEAVPEGDYTVPIGDAKIVREGKDATLFAYGTQVHHCIEVANAFEKEGVSLEIVELRTVWPFDKDAVLNSAKKTGRVVCITEAPAICSIASEISALIAERAIEFMQAPIQRVTGYYTPYPYWADRYYWPTPKRITAAVRDALAY